MSLVVQEVQAFQIYALRHRILRSGLPWEEAMFLGDELPTTLHVGAIMDGKVIGCATMMQEGYQNRKAWRLRGMAVDTTVQGTGAGTAILQFIERHTLILTYSDLLWCNARLIALNFYKKNGWIVDSDLFDIPTAGPHHRMYRNLLIPLAKTQ